MTETITFNFSLLIFNLSATNMGDKHRWSDPANEGQVNYVKVGVRAFALIMLLTLAAALKIAIANDWLGSFSENMRILGF